MLSWSKEGNIKPSKKTTSIAKKHSRRKRSTTPDPHIYKSPNRYPSLGFAILSSVIGYALPFIWLEAIASTFLVIAPLAFVGGFLLYLELCKLFDVWPFEPSNSWSSVFSVLNPVTYIVTPSDILKSIKAFYQITKEGFQQAWAWLTDWGKDVDRKAMTATRNFEKRYIDQRARPSRHFRDEFCFDPKATHQYLALNLRASKSQYTGAELEQFKSTRAQPTPRH
jgi:hypothetical protein